MKELATTALAASVALAGYAYVGYAGLLKAISWLRRAPRRVPPVPPASAAGDLPMISITIPVYNEVETISATLERLLAVDYPAERRQILVVSDASTDGTDDIVRGFASRGVELLRLPARGGKTVAENAALPLLRGEIIINTDATIVIESGALRSLVAAFADASVGVASGRDVSVARMGDLSNQGESGYVGYEMWLRDLETRVDGIVGASGCLYAIRAELHQTVLPGDLSRDFAAALVAREHGFRAVSVPDAVCFVPRTASLRQEFRRKVRTMTRGMQTLWHKRRLLDPTTHGIFSWMLFSHKLCRWLVPWAGVTGLAALGVLSVTAPWARWLLAGSAALITAGTLGWAWPEGKGRPRPPIVLSLPGYFLSGNVAALVAAMRTLRGRRQPTWEPTRRERESATAPAG